MQESNWFSILGNHEEMYLQYDYGYDNGENWLFSNFNDCCQSTVSKEQNDKNLKYLKTLPYAIEVKTNSGLIGLSHARVPNEFRSWRQFTNNLHHDNVQRECTWSYGCNDYPIEEVDLTIHGHMVYDDEVKSHNSIWIDIGAHFRKKMIIYQIHPSIERCGVL